MCVPADIVGKLTPLGNGVIEVDRDSGHVTMTMKPRTGLTLRHNINVMDDGTVVLDMWEGKKIPKIGEEKTIGKKSGEVTGVTIDHGGTVWVYLDGNKIKYDE